MEDKKHWYDGRIYDKFIAPNQDKMYRIIKSLIPKNATVLDVGTGTGRFPLQLSNHASEIVGIDLSSLNIKVANKNLKKQQVKNVKFIHDSILNIEKYSQNKYDVSITTFVLHEMNPNLRVETLKAMKKNSNKIIIGDYLVPRPKGNDAVITYLIEFFAGVDHFRNFRHFVRNGGLEGLAKEAGLTITKNINTKLPFTQIVVME